MGCGHSGVVVTEAESVRSEGLGVELVAHTSREWKVLSKLFQVTSQEARCIGLDPDVQGGDCGTGEQQFNGFKPVLAWKIKTGRRTIYDAQVELLKQEAAQLQQVSRMLRVATKLDKAATPLGLNPGINEHILLHGARCDDLLSILRRGLNERVSAGDFGRAVHLAEDPSRSDEICDPDVGSPDLLQALYNNCGVKHPGHVYYAFVCRVALGYPLFTKNGIHAMDRAGMDLYATDDMSELAAVPGSHPPIHHHSLVVQVGPRDKGYKLQTHREFVVFNSNTILEEYVVAYERTLHGHPVRLPCAPVRVPLERSKTTMSSTLGEIERPSSRRSLTGSRTSRSSLLSGGVERTPRRAVTADHVSRSTIFSGGIERTQRRAVTLPTGSLAGADGPRMQEVGSPEGSPCVSPRACSKGSGSLSPRAMSKASSATLGTRSPSKSSLATNSQLKSSLMNLIRDTVTGSRAQILLRDKVLYMSGTGPWDCFGGMRGSAPLMWVRAPQGGPAISAGEQSPKQRQECNWTATVKCRFSIASDHAAALFTVYDGPDGSGQLAFGFGPRTLGDAGIGYQPTDSEELMGDFGIDPYQWHELRIQRYAAEDDEQASPGGTVRERSLFDLSYRPIDDFASDSMDAEFLEREPSEDEWIQVATAVVPFRGIKGRRLAVGLRLAQSGRSEVMFRDLKITKHSD